MPKSLKTNKKQRTFNRISYEDRVIIENRYCVDKKSISDIAKELDRPASTISREIGGKSRIGSKYSADIAQAESGKESGGSRKKNEV